MLAALGIGVHHAGLTLDDRRVTEDLFLKKIIRVVVATSVSFPPSICMLVCYTTLHYEDLSGRCQPA